MAEMRTGKRACNHHSDCAEVERRHPGEGHCYDPDCSAGSAEWCRNVQAGNGSKPRVEAPVEARVEVEVQELRRQLWKASDGVDYWYQVSQAIVLLLLRRHLPYDQLERVLFDVESQAATGFADLEKTAISRAVCLHSFGGLRSLYEERQARKERER